MTTTNPLIPPGIYDSLLDHSLQQILTKNPDLRAVLAKIDTEEQPSRYATFVAKLLEQALREESVPENRLALCNRIIEILSGNSQPDDQASRKLVADQKSLLLEITPPHYGRGRPGIPRPQTSLVESSLFTGSPRESQLVHELLQEMRSAELEGSDPMSVDCIHIPFPLFFTLFYPLFILRPYGGF